MLKAEGGGSAPFPLWRCLLCATPDSRDSQTLSRSRKQGIQALVPRTISISSGCRVLSGRAVRWLGEADVALCVDLRRRPRRGAHSVSYCVCTSVRMKPTPQRVARSTIIVTSTLYHDVGSVSGGIKRTSPRETKTDPLPSAKKVPVYAATYYTETEQEE